jgi:CheY-like chemotaxis protein/HPt (histidine-containing phosphotransfer) domain-containing protein
MDIQMPVMDGYEATREIRKLESQRRQMEPAQTTSDRRQSPYSNIPEQSSDIGRQSSIQRVPIIAMTGHAVEGYRKECLEVGMDDYLTKPLTGKHFLAMVDKWTRVTADAHSETSRLLSAAQRGTVMPYESELFQRSNNHRSDKGPLIDFEKALNEFEGDKTLLMEVLAGFVQNVRGQIGIIRQALICHDADRVRIEAHSIKGGAANLRADELSRMAFELEHIGKSGELERGDEVLKRLENELNDLEKLQSTL